MDHGASFFLSWTDREKDRPLSRDAKAFIRPRAARGKAISRESLDDFQDGRAD
jgi:hypothetical protein